MKSNPRPEPASGETGVRLNKYLSSSGVASRRKADVLIQEGHVAVNGKVVDQLGLRIDPEQDRVTVDGRQIADNAAPVYIIFNKPKDSITTARDERGRTTVMDFLRVKERVFPIGRLDRNTTGVLLLTNDGSLAHRLMHPSHEITKAYRVKLNNPLERDHVRQLVKGVKLSDGMTAPAKVQVIPGSHNKEIGIIIHEGRNRQVHRMFEALGYAVVKLDRVAYAGITYEGLPRGRWRYLTRTESKQLLKSAGLQDTSRRGE
jgi:23S rRNA pseudouridine2605 synthase